MKIITLMILATILISCTGADTERTRCNRNARENGLETDMCMVLLPLFYGKTDPERQRLFDYILVNCLLYNVEMYKCEKKSNIFPLIGKSL